MRVGLYPTCLGDMVFPSVALSALKVLRRLGVDVVTPRRPSCCGQPAFNAGYWEEARPLAEGFLKVVSDFLDDGADLVVLPSGSCAGMAVHGFEALLGGGRCEPLGRVRELSQFLVDDLGVEDVGASFPGRATYHPSCHGRRILGIDDEPLRLLRHVRGLRLDPLPYEEDCCGFGGTFSVKMASVSTAMADEKVRHVGETGADLLIVNDMACGMHLGGRLGRLGAGVGVRHWVEILAGEEGAEHA